MNWTAALGKQERFSKALVAKTLGRKVYYLQKAHRFDPNNGWAQVEGKGEEINRAYGEYVALINLASMLDIVQAMWTVVSKLNFAKIQEIEEDIRKSKESEEETNALA